MAITKLLKKAVKKVVKKKATPIGKPLKKQVLYKSLADFEKKMGKKVVKKKTTPKKDDKAEARKKAKATKRKTNQLLAAYRPADSAGGGTRKHYDKDIVKKAATNIASIAKKRGIPVKEFRKNNLMNKNVQIVYNDNFDLVYRDGGNKLFDRILYNNGKLGRAYPNIE